MLFEKGNNAAAKPSKKVVAALIRQRMEKNRETLSNAEFTTLSKQYTALTAKRRRPHRKEPEAEKLSQVEKLSRSFADMLTGDDAEMHKAVLRIEAERLETRRKEWRAKQKEPIGNTV
jgi:hypothetical protein